MLLRFVLPKMLERDAKSGVINVSSQSALLKRPGSIIYGPSKRFEDVLSRSVAHEVKANIDMLSVRPLYFTSSMTEKAHLTSTDCAKATLDKLGYEDTTAGHWQHNLQATLIDWLVSVLLERAYD